MSQGRPNALSGFLGRDPGHAGAHHWRAQRVGALALIPLTIWFLASVLAMRDHSYAAMQAWVAGWRIVPLCLLVFCVTWHSLLGVQVVIEDYVHGKAAQSRSLALNTIVHLLLGIAGIAALLAIALKD